MIPKDSKNGEKIWIFELFNRNVEFISQETEPVYFYYFPEVDKLNIPKGMKFGITYNGQDTDLDPNIKEINKRIKPNTTVIANKPERGTVQVRLYIKMVTLIQVIFLDN
ncbi:MAG: hypothetical protein ACL7BU_03710 [Candidatus Phlomobacter fragariae]